MTTIVSGFASSNNCFSKNIENYCKWGIKLLKINVPKIIFAEENMYEKIKSYENEYTHIILYDKKESYLNSYIINSEHHLSNFNKLSSKDTLEYMFIMCNKTEWMKKAIEINYFNTNQFMWIDFGIRKVCNGDKKNNNDDDDDDYDEPFNQTIMNTQNKAYSNVRIGSIWNPYIDYNFDKENIYVNNIYCNNISWNVYKKIFWFFAGGVFGGNKDVLLQFSDKMKEMCIKIITEKQTLMWEVNIWYIIFLENKELFDCYQCNHSISIIQNY